MQIDYGWWPRTSGGQGIRARVTYDEAAGVLFAFHPDLGAEEVLAAAPDRTTIDVLMAGWWDHVDTDGLDWVRDRIEGVLR